MMQAAEKLGQDTLLDEIEIYWSKRADSYSQEVRYEMAHENEQNWMGVLTEYLKNAPGKKILDIGTGPGFFAIGLAKRGYQMTAVDYTPNMLSEARKNAKDLEDQIAFLRMDAQHLNFPDTCFDGIVTRNLTWNLEQPEQAYREWHRVLKKGGIMLNFDAGWYNYLFDDRKAQEFSNDRRNVKDAKIKDFEAYSESAKMEEISRKLILSRCQRPNADVEMLYQAGFRKVFTDLQIGARVLDEVEKINYGSRKMFMLCAIK